MAVVALSTLDPGDTFSYDVSQQGYSAVTPVKTTNFILVGATAATAGTRVVYNIDTHLFQELDQTLMVTTTTLEAVVNTGYVIS